ncbi:hypothetical protein BD413DRAFT_494841 [Trametes elegans]|nr:hypothetical protein BD413DRAFT_494841 [Trametes elegans]
MAFRTRLSVSDILHRGLVWSLLGVSVWGIVMIGAVHQNTLRAGREALAKQEALGEVQVPKQIGVLEDWTRTHAGCDLDVQEEKKEIELAEAAQAVLKGRANSP